MACSKCFSGAIHDHAEPQGRLEDVYGYKTYVTGDKEATSKSVILYLPDIFSLKLVNNKLLADRYAQGTGCKVLVPDIIPLGGANTSYIGHMDVIMGPEPISIMNGLSRFWSILNVLPIIPYIFYVHPKGIMPEIVKYARAIKKDLPEGGKLGVCGFCWGGYGSTLLCAEPAVQGGSEPLIDAQFTGHPSFLTVPDMFLSAMSKFNVPYSAAFAEHDNQINEKMALEAEAVLREKVGSPEDKNWEFKYYKGANHGFAVRAHPAMKADNDGFHAAAKQAIDWYNKYLN